ncbi:hypothetical protein KAR91_23740 [Candidatus Pacearchaeota archaeon]|nr:hypothetical protein [Candidatus Pacearchaeota archaeon]
MIFEFILIFGFLFIGLIFWIGWYWNMEKIDERIAELTEELNEEEEEE